MFFQEVGVGSGQLFFDDLSKEDAEKLNAKGVFINRASQEWYEYVET